MGIFNRKKNNKRFVISYKEIIERLSPFKSDLDDMVRELRTFEKNYYKQNKNEFEEMYGYFYSDKNLNKYLSNKYDNISIDAKLSLILDDYEVNYGECIYNAGCSCNSMIDKDIDIEEFKMPLKRMIIMRIKISENCFTNCYQKWKYYAFNYSDIDNVGNCFVKKEELIVNNCECYALIDAFNNGINLYKNNKKIIL